MPKKVDVGIEVKATAYLGLKKQIKGLEDECKMLRPELESYIDNNGHTNDKGTIVAVLPYNGKEVFLKKTCRETCELVPDAIEHIKGYGLEECIENVPTIREDVLERLVLEGKAPQELLKKIYTFKKSYAFSVDVK